MCQHSILVPHSKDLSQPRLINNISSLLTDSFNEEMPPTFSQFQRLKLVTEFIDGCYKHTIAGTPPRCETWTRAETLGEGSFSTVYKENCNQTSAVRAVKQIRKALAKPNELAILAKLGSYPDNFVKLSGWFEDQNHIYLAMEYLPAGDLDTFLKEQDLSEDDTKRVTKQILAGLEIMHKEAICHRDLKPGNILIARWTPVWVKIADFGVSKDLSGSTECRTETGTRCFMAPEVLGLGDTSEDSSEYTTAVDIWSLGCLVYFMFTKRPPFPELRRLIDFLQGKSTFHPSSSVLAQNHIPHPAIEFMAGLLRPLPNDRPRASEAQSHSWLCTLLPRRLNDLGIYQAIEDSSWFIHHCPAEVTAELSVGMDERSSDTPSGFQSSDGSFHANFATVNESQPHSDPSATPGYGHDPYAFRRLPRYMKVRNDHGLLDCFQDCRQGRFGKSGFKKRVNLLLHLTYVHN